MDLLRKSRRRGVRTWKRNRQSQGRRLSILDRSLCPRRRFRPTEIVRDRQEQEPPRTAPAVRPRAGLQISAAPQIRPRSEARPEPEPQPQVSRWAPASARHRRKASPDGRQSGFAVAVRERSRGVSARLGPRREHGSPPGRRPFESIRREARIRSARPASSAQPRRTPWPAPPRLRQHS